MPSGYPFSKSVKWEFFDRVCRGEALTDVAHDLGASRDAGTRWWRQAGSMKIHTGGRGRAFRGLVERGNLSLPGGRGHRLNDAERVAIMRAATPNCRQLDSEGEPVLVGPPSFDAALVNVQPQVVEQSQRIQSLGCSVVDLTNDPNIGEPVEDLMRMVSEERADIEGLRSAMSKATSVFGFIAMWLESFSAAARMSARRQQIEAAIKYLEAYYLMTQLPPTDEP